MKMVTMLAAFALALAATFSGSADAASSDGQPACGELGWAEGGLSVSPSVASCGPSANDAPPSEWTLKEGNGPDIRACTLTLMAAIDQRFCQVEATLGPAACETKPEASNGADGEGDGQKTSAGKLLDILKSRSTDLGPAISRKIFGGSSPALVCGQMRIDRAAWGEVIERRLAATAGSPSADGARPYANMYEAANDLLAYDRAGLPENAAVSLANRTATKAHNAEARKQQR